MKELNVWGAYSHTDEGETLTANVRTIWNTFVDKQSPPREDWKDHSIVKFAFEYKTEIPERSLKLPVNLLQELPSDIEELKELVKSSEGYKTFRETLLEIINQKTQSSLAHKFILQRERYVMGLSKTGENSKPTPFKKNERALIFDEFKKYYSDQRPRIVIKTLNAIINQIGL